LISVQIMIKIVFLYQFIITIFKSLMIPCTLVPKLFTVYFFNLIKQWILILHILTRGPKGPLVAHLRKRSQRSHLQRTLMLSTKYYSEDLSMMLYIKLWKLWILYFQRRCFKIAFWKPNFWPRDLLMQPIKIIWTILVGDNPGISFVKLVKFPLAV